MSNFEKLFQSFNYQPKMIPHMCRWLVAIQKVIKQSSIAEKKYKLYEV